MRNGNGIGTTALIGVTGQRDEGAGYRIPASATVLLPEAERELEKLKSANFGGFGSS